MNSYTPFDKELRELVAHDLVALKEVSEGWYIEYKREPPTATSISKSISAFANTYGGWLFVGIEEGSKERPVAGRFNGIAKYEVDPFLQSMRQAVASHVNPTPHFESHVVWGPSIELDLPDGRAVVCVQILWGQNAPYIHKNGLIYRRIADGSEPKPESDRFVLDQLWKRGNDLKQYYKDWHDKDPEFSSDEKARPYIRLLLVADLWRDRGAWLDATLDEVRELLGQKIGAVASIPFDSVHLSADGFIGRQLANNDPYNLGMTWRLRASLASEILIPLPYILADGVAEVARELKGYEFVERYIQILNRYPHSKLKIIDLNQLFVILIGVVEIQRRLLAKAKWTGSYFMKAKVLNGARFTPYVDVASVLNDFEKHGIPMCFDATTTTFRGAEPDTYFEISENDQESEVAKITVQSALLFAPIAHAFGIPSWITNESEDGPYYHVDLQEAGKRAVEVQALRNRRLRK